MKNLILLAVTAVTISESVKSEASKCLNRSGLFLKRLVELSGQEFDEEGVEFEVDDAIEDTKLLIKGIQDHIDSLPVMNKKYEQYAYEALLSAEECLMLLESKKKSKVKDSSDLSEEEKEDIEKQKLADMNSALHSGSVPNPKLNEHGTIEQGTTLVPASEAKNEPSTFSHGQTLAVNVTEEGNTKTEVPASKTEAPKVESAKKPK